MIEKATRLYCATIVSHLCQISTDRQVFRVLFIRGCKCSFHIITEANSSLRRRRLRLDTTSNSSIRSTAPGAAWPGKSLWFLTSWMKSYFSHGLGNSQSLDLDVLFHDTCLPGQDRCRRLPRAFETVLQCRAHGETLERFRHLGSGPWSYCRINRLILDTCS